MFTPRKFDTPFLKPVSPASVANRAWQRVPNIILEHYCRYVRLEVDGSINYILQALGAHNAYKDQNNIWFGEPPETPCDYVVFDDDSPKPIIIFVHDHTNRAILALTLTELGPTIEPGPERSVQEDDLILATDWLEFRPLFLWRGMQGPLNG